MPQRRDVEFLREKAARFRQIAATCDARIAAKLLDIAADLDAKAREIEARQAKP